MFAVRLIEDLCAVLGTIRIAVLFKNLLAFEYNSEIDILLPNAGGADLSGVISAVGGIWIAPVYSDS